MARVFLIGDPVSHSLSPAMQNAAFAAMGLPHRYELRRLRAEEVAEFLGSAMRGADVLGANVTIPHKEIVAPHLDGVEETARRIGAVNTIFKRDGKLWGENTDVDGFAGALAERGVDVAERRVLVLGAGGAAKACVHHLLRAGAAVSLANRSPERATSLIETFHNALPSRSEAGDSVGVANWPLQDLVRYHVVVNATSLGMHGEDALTGLDLPSSTVVVDVVATAQETPLIARARASGCVAVDGLLMLLHQGTRAFRLWTERDAPIDVMRAALPRAV